MVKEAGVTKGFFLGLKFTILGFFWVGKLSTSKYFCFLVPWFIEVFFWGGGGYSKQSEDWCSNTACVSMLAV